MNPNSPNSSVVDPAGSDKGPADNGAGQPGDVNYEELYKELESKLGDQGRELGEYRTFFEGVSPILDTLDKSPELVKAIVEGKLDNDTAQAALDGKLTIGEIEVVDKAHTDVKKDLGAKTYDKTSVEDIAKLVEEKVTASEKKMNNTMRESEELRSFENRVNDFVSRTKDFPTYAEDVEKWLGDHKDINDIEVAYFAVKGQTSEKEAAELAEKDRAEHAKDLALNAGGGGNKSNFIDKSDGEAIDRLIAPRSNPNVF